VNGVPPKKRKRIENEIQMSIEDLCAKFQNLSKTNLIVYLFGKKSKRIMTRLNDFYNLINKSPSFIKDRPDFVQYITENRDIDKDEIASGRDLKKNREIINPSESGDQEKKLMKKQRDSQINDFFLECAKYLNRNQTKILNLMIHYDQHQSKVAQKLGFSKGYVSQEYKKILEKLSNNPHLNNLIKDIL
jgi:DNA-directed RNA polymerase specialized sigma subunit